MEEANVTCRLRCCCDRLVCVSVRWRNEERGEERREERGVDGIDSLCFSLSATAHSESPLFTHVDMQCNACTDISVLPHSSDNKYGM